MEDHFNFWMSYSIYFPDRSLLLVLSSLLILQVVHTYGLPWKFGTKCKDNRTLLSIHGLSAKAKTFKYNIFFGADEISNFFFLY